MNYQRGAEGEEERGVGGGGGGGGGHPPPPPTSPTGPPQPPRPPNPGSLMQVAYYVVRTWQSEHPRPPRVRSRTQP